MAVDDNSFNLFVLKETLQKIYEIKICQSGDEAIEEIKNKLNIN